MNFKYFHLGLRQVVMALMNWAIDVPLELNKVMQYPLYPSLLLLKKKPNPWIIIIKRLLYTLAIFFKQKIVPLK